MESVGRLERAYAALCACGSAMVRAISENQLLDAVTGILVDVGGYRMVWVGYAEAGPGRPVVARAAAGVNQDYLETVRISWADDPRGRGPTGLAIRTGEVCVNRDSRWEPDYEPWRESALRNGFASSIALPLRLDGSVFGALSVYATTPDAFDSEERTLLERFAEDVAFAIGALRARAALQHRDRQLQQAATMAVVGQLASGVIHDFNNLLAVARTCGSELVTLLPPGSPGRPLAEDIVQAVKRATELSDRMLTLTRVSAPTVRAQAPGPILRGLLPLIVRAVGRDITTEVSIAPDVGPIEIDRSHLEQVLLNLAINARDAMPRGGRLFLGLADAGAIPATAVPANRTLGRAVELEVRDAGVGMSGEVTAQLFQPFFTTKPEGRGTGLGLSVVWGIVEHYGGQIAVESAVGTGTTFRIFFPLARPASGES